MEVQVSIKIHDHVKAKLLALAALGSVAGAIVGAQVAVPEAGPYIGCALLCGLFAYVTRPCTPDHTRTQPVTAEDTESVTALSTIIDTETGKPSKVKPTRTRKAAAPRARLLAVPA